jgi:hypothetical protein
MTISFNRSCKQSTFLLFMISLFLIQTDKANTEPPGGLLERDREVYSEQREKTRINRAVVHYTRSRSLLLAAIDEFDKGRSLADPSLLLEGDEWRATIVEKAQEMERVIAPRAREATVGVALPADSRLIGTGAASPAAQGTSIIPDEQLSK